MKTSDRCLTIRLHPMKRGVLARIEKLPDTGEPGRYAAQLQVKLVGSVRAWLHMV
ncbi:MAG: hypothetical protein F6K19_51825 [Cyanothece sp. SIO1E1]|nr:hypothetical protein [Cyanothece sp. SIO1E1]